LTSDRARISYDPSRAYHGVVAQQGRVSLEADWNEAQAIAGAQLQARTRDFVGRAGSPDGGYAITPAMDGADATGDLLIGAGSLYVGGQRVVAQPARYGEQPEWADHEGDPLWRAPGIPAEPQELVYLLAREQEVSAVEDPALRDVALGGPDTTQRLRIVPHVIRHPTTARNWEDGWAQLLREQWAPRGFRLDDASRRLDPAVRLQVTSYSEDSAEQAVGHGGYLGPNNQLIRVQIADVDARGVPVLAWGYDNASFLYRLSSAVAGVSQTALRLAAPPVDAYHQPREHQVVEVLRSAAPLTREDYVAASAGVLAKVTTAYNADSGQLVIGTELPPHYRKLPGEGLPLYLRVWEGEVRCTPGEEHELGASGVRVRLTVPEDEHPGGYPVGAYWMIAVRPGVGPGARGLVYPQRIVDFPQPPDGPRQWLTPLAFVRWNPRPPRTEDCVPRFDGLARAERTTGSATVWIGPHDVGGGWGLQNVIDAHARRGHPAAIHLAPGTYTLPCPLRIGPEHGRLTIKATAPGVVLRAERNAAARFLLGMIIVADADGFALEGVEVHLAHTRFVMDRETYRSMPERARLVLDAHHDRVISIGLHAARSTGLSVDSCRFIVTLPEPGEPHAGERRREEDLFSAAIFGAEKLRGLRVTRCTFTATEPIDHARRRPRSREAAGARHHVAIGVVHVPTALAAPPPEGGEGSEDAHPGGSTSIPLLAEAVFDGNTFEHLTAPVVAIGQLGQLRLERNLVRDCHAGFWLVTLYGSHVLTLLDRLVNQVDDAYRDLVTALLSALTEPLLFHATTLARVLPLALPEDPDAPARPRRLEPPSAADDRDASELFARLTAADAAREPSSAPAQRENRRRRFLDTFGRARGTRTRPEHVEVPARAALRCDLNISGNVLDSDDAPGLVVLDTAPDSDASLILTGNQLRGRPRPGAAVCLYLLQSCAVAANVIVHPAAQDEGDASLVVLASRHEGRHQTAVTGNVLVGGAHLPSRADDQPGWESLNSVTR
jgi:hypothetical protein